MREFEKPTKYFCSLENKNFVEKTIKRVTLPNGENITDQTYILKSVREFYENLFENKDHLLHDFDLDNTLRDIPYTKLSETEAEKLEGVLTVKEIGDALYKMKTNKTPGIDGFPAEFYKTFWLKLKYFVLRSLNCSFRKGELSISLRQTIITCLPKGNKPREKLKNWRPLSMLSVVYKIASASLANRIKPVLDKIISKTQNGFVPGRYIGESTRLVYDIMHCTEKYDISGLLMLIDFEKAFDSISWKFLYNTLELFGFGPTIIRWIKVLNYNIIASVLQCGFLSESFKVGRGCKQGDPIAPYLFIICGQILSLLMTHNKDISGITIDGNEFILTQFADDTTLFLDGSQESLQAALNILEIYGSISGLKVNTEKTKLVWLGPKRATLEKLDVSTPLEWGTTEFVLLGLEFSVYSNRMVEMNYNKAFEKIERNIRQWKRRYLTPLGKITVIKTLFLSKLNHLFLSLPTPNNNILIHINNIMYKFVWDNGPDKIKRTIITQEYKYGGLKMIDICTFIKGLKATWMRRLVKSESAPWVTLFESQICKIGTMVTFGNLWFSHLINKTSNQFWKDILTIWQEIGYKQKFTSNYDVLNSPIWYNHKIVDTYSFYLAKWHKCGIKFINDIIDETGKVLTYEVIKEKFNNNSLKLFEYYQLRGLVSKFLLKNKLDEVFCPNNPFIPFYYKILYKTPKGSRDFYNILSGKIHVPEIIEKWNNLLNLSYTLDKWHIIFKTCYTIHDNRIVWFQYRILHRILGTRNLLHKLKITDNSNCRLCNQASETILHLFVECPKSQILWENVKTWIHAKIKIHLDLTPSVIILGYTNPDRNYFTINAILMTVKYYIFSNALISRNMSIYTCQKFLRKVYNEQESLAVSNNQNRKFVSKWSKWQLMFIEIDH